MDEDINPVVSAVSCLGKIGHNLGTTRGPSGKLDKANGRNRITLSIHLPGLWFLPHS